MKRAGWLFAWMVLQYGCYPPKFTGITHGIPDAKEIKIAGRYHTLALENLNAIEVGDFERKQRSERSKSGLFRNLDVIVDSQFAVVQVEHASGLRINTEIIQTRVTEKRTETKFSKALTDTEKDGHTVAHKMLFNDYAENAELTNREFGLFVKLKTPRGDWQLHSVGKMPPQHYYFKNGNSTIEMSPIWAKNINGKFRAGMEFRMNGKQIAAMQSSPGLKLWLARDISTEGETLVSTLAACYWKGFF